MKAFAVGLILIVLAAGAFFYFKGMPNYGQNGVNGSLTSQSQPTEKPETTEENVKEFTVTGSKFKFDPKEISVKQGDTVRIIFKNADGLHDFVLDEFNAKTKQINTGEEETIEFVADKTGEFQYYCSVGSHRANGMWGTLKVN